MSRSFWTIILLVLSNAFMTTAWYGHLKFKELKWLGDLGIFGFILVSWAIAFFEYCLQVPANRIGYKVYGGNFSLMELKIIQESIAITVFILFSYLFFRNEQIKINHLISLLFIMLAVYFAFKK